MPSSKERHARMIGDSLRTAPLISAIRNTVKAGDIVVDIGTGLGILAIEAAKCGAKTVHAIEIDTEAIAMARKNAHTAGLHEKIIFHEQLSFNSEIGCRADVIICETVGSFAFDENILSTLIDAKKRFLSADGTIIPQKLQLWGAGLSKIPATNRISETGKADSNHIVTEPTLLAAVDFKESFSDSIHVKQSLKCISDCEIKGFALWPKAFWGKSDITDASPFSAPTHWEQGIIGIEPRRFVRNEKATLEFIIGPHPENPMLMTERLWRWA
ncbi:MAG TPA: 50S ribosomal protein L11 methyltransferase [bacterium]|nr:methyltransferase [Myxococcales bacterium]HPW45300.1 50S ribosomal protein L11 methyltransferase [bacterium]HQC51027.1 50S ribosomal protein L11 methyltransferase [bacterium]HQH80624.1 50S ribosomal protein L11 methyltransferase [bacterium]